MKAILLIASVSFSLNTYSKIIELKADQLEAVVLNNGEYARPIDFEMGIVNTKGIHFDIDTSKLEIDLNENTATKFILENGDIINSKGIEVMATGGEMGGGGNA